MTTFTMCAVEDADQAGPDGRTGEAQNRELDVTDVAQPPNVGDVQFTDSADHALGAAAASFDRQSLTLPTP